MLKPAPLLSVSPSVEVCRFEKLSSSLRQFDVCLILKEIFREIIDVSENLIFQLERAKGGPLVF